jgi:triosephosphate isomerase
MRKPIIAGNWKMNLGRVEEALEFVRQIRSPLYEIENVDRVICPPFTVLAALAEVIQANKIGLGAQNIHWEESGAHTGDISGMMIVGLCQYVIIGHSERREIGGTGESDEAIHKKVRAALGHGLTPIICVGENLAQKEAGETQAFVGGQVRAALTGLDQGQISRCVLAYEPIWAIGTGQAATAVEANRIIGITIRGAIAETFGESAAQQVRVQYGGSVNTGNIAEYMSMPEIDGALVGGASLKPEFVELIRQASPTS